MFGPSDDGWDAALGAFMLGAEQWPATVVVAASTADVWRAALRVRRGAPRSAADAARTGA